MAAEPIGRAMPLVERLQRLVEGIDAPIAAFARDGTLAGASDAARPLLGFRNLSGTGLEDVREEALKQGRAETAIGTGHMVLQRARQRRGCRPDCADHAAGGSADARLRAAGDNGGSASRVRIDGRSREIACSAGIRRAAEADLRTALQLDADLVAASAGTPAQARPAETATPDGEAHEPSPFVEAVADEPSENTYPLRFMWQMDAEGRFWLGAGEFTRLIDARSVGFGRPWSEIYRCAVVSKGRRPTPQSAGSEAKRRHRTTRSPQCRTKYPGARTPRDEGWRRGNAHQRRPVSAGCRAEIMPR